MTFHYVTYADLLESFADRGIELVVRDAGLLEAALARPQATVFGSDAYPDAWTKAAAVMHSVVTSHPFVDGNNRAGLIGALGTLRLNEVDISGGNHEAFFQLTVDVAAGKINDVGEIAVRLRAALPVAVRR